MNYSESNFYINLYSLFGLVVSVYSYYVKVRYLKDPLKYKAVCDINDHMSCSRVISSKYKSTILLFKPTKLNTNLIIF